MLLFSPYFTWDPKVTQKCQPSDPKGPKVTQQWSQSDPKTSKVIQKWPACDPKSPTSSNSYQKVSQTKNANMGVSNKPRRIHRAILSYAFPYVLCFVLLYSQKGIMNNIKKALVLLKDNVFMETPPAGRVHKNKHRDGEYCISNPLRAHISPCLQLRDMVISQTTSPLRIA